MRIEEKCSKFWWSRSNPLIRGWYNYFKKFYKSETYPVPNYMNPALVYWARRKD